MLLNQRNITKHTYTHIGAQSFTQEVFFKHTKIWVWCETKVSVNQIQFTISLVVSQHIYPNATWQICLSCSIIFFIVYWLNSFEDWKYCKEPQFPLWVRVKVKSKKVSVLIYISVEAGFYCICTTSYWRLHC